MDMRFNGKLHNQVATANTIFANIFRVIESDLEEEVIGQERLPGSLVRQLSKLLPTSNKDTVSLMAEKLYPIAILSASMHQKSKIPTPENEIREGFRDIDTFINEWNSQFGRNEERNLEMTKDDFFMECLKTAWHLKRSNFTSF